MRAVSTILAYWLDQPTGMIFLLLGAAFLTVSGILVLLTNLPFMRPLMLRPGTGMVPTAFTAISVLLALLTGFVANDAWERERQAARIVQTERANILAAHDLSKATASDMKEVRAALLRYVDALIEQEWPLMAVVGDPEQGSRAGMAAHAALLDTVRNLRSARGDRLALSDAQADQSKWLTLMVLAGLTLLALALTHLDRPVAQATVLGLFSTAMVVTLGVVALHARPFDGPTVLSPAPHVAARHALTAPE